MTINLHFCRFIAALSLFPMTSCSTIIGNAQRSREQRDQANDSVIGTNKLLRSAARTLVFGTLRQPVTTTKLGLAVLWHRPRELFVSNIPFDIQLMPPPAEIPGTPAFERLLDQQGFPAVEYGTLKWLVDGNEFFPELDLNIASARSGIDIQVYIFDNDDIAVRYADKLKARSRETKVRVLFDDIGSAFAHTSPPETPAPKGFVPPKSIARHLREGSRVHVRRIANPWLVADHSKLMVFDRRVAMLGGMNIGREYYSEWHDLMVRVDGPIVGSLADDFGNSWRHAGPGGDLAFFRAARKRQDPPAVSGQYPMRILRTDPAAGRYEILDSMLLAIRAARKRIWIENPYVASDEIALALQSAARNGVDVRLILPEKGDSAIMDAGNIATARGIIEAGGRVYLYPKMTHMKVMIADQWATVGSANLDTLSMRINRELNFSLSDPDAIRGLERKVFLPDFARSRQMRLEETKSAVAPVAEVIADQL